MAYSKFWTDVATHFQNNWSRTPIAWSNVQYDPQDNLDGSGDLQPFVQFEPQDGEATKQELGQNGRVDRPGVLFLGVNVPTGIGQNEARDIVDDLVEMFEETHIGDAYFRAPRVTVNGRSDDDVWFEINANFPFRIQD